MWLRLILQFCCVDSNYRLISTYVNAWNSTLIYFKTYSSVLDRSLVAIVILLTYRWSLHQNAQVSSGCKMSIALFQCRVICDTLLICCGYVTIKLEVVPWPNFMLPLKSRLTVHFSIIEIQINQISLFTNYKNINHGMFYVL